MGDQDNNLDLLIFKYRGMQSPAIKAKPKQQAEPQQKQIAVPKENAVQPAKVQQKREIAETEQKSAEGFCVNHPWRRAYATCDICKLPFCYAEIMEHDGMYYCLSDIDAVMNKEGPVKRSSSAGVNTFSVVASVLLLVNSAVLGVFTYPQIEFVVSSALKQGVVSFITSINQLYYPPLANAFIIVFGLLAALAVTRKSTLMFTFAFSIVFASLFLIVYEYLATSVYYFLPSGMLLVITVMFSAYSRMSSLTDTRQEIAATALNWPKPETF